VSALALLCAFYEAVGRCWAEAARWGWEVRR